MTHVRRYTCRDCMVTLVHLPVKGTLPIRCPACKELIKSRRYTKKPRPCAEKLNLELVARATNHRLALEEVRHVLSMGLLGQDIGRYSLAQSVADAMAVLNAVDLRPIEIERSHEVCLP